MARAETVPALFARIRAAIAESERHTARAGELVAFVRALRKTPPATVVLCAWCGRIGTEGYWLDPEELMHGRPARLNDRASHGICPGCFERVSAAAELVRRDASS